MPSRPLWRHPNDAGFRMVMVHSSGPGDHVNWVFIGLDNVMAPLMRQTTIQMNGELSAIRPYKIFNGILHKAKNNPTLNVAACCSG